MQTNLITISEDAISLICNECGNKKFAWEKECYNCTKKLICNACHKIHENKATLTKTLDGADHQICADGCFIYCPKCFEKHKVKFNKVYEDHICNICYMNLD